eukprot:comp18502_c1_seq1/m.19883 comp18502_c1_seq1/g.19883  ORF comp18502_c1_seq1/g.19883 comp18502_c1_seq1/m.19883 type:complete len:247 (-) comp18502_c1_seq1:336-1076(-)
MAFLNVFVVACLGFAGVLGDQINVKTSSHSGKANPGGVFLNPEGYATTKAVNQTYLCLYPDSSCSQWQKARCQVLAAAGKCEVFVGNANYPTLSYKYTKIDTYTLNIDVYEDVKCGNEAQVRHLLESTNDMYTCPPIMGINPPAFVQIEISSEGNPGLDSGKGTASASSSSSSSAPVATPAATTSKTAAAASTPAAVTTSVASQTAREQKASSQMAVNPSAAASAIPTIVTMLVIFVSLVCFVFIM